MSEAGLEAQPLIFQSDIEPMSQPGAPLEKIKNRITYGIDVFFAPFQ